MINLITITDDELWCIIVGLEQCSGEDFDPLLIKMYKEHAKREYKNNLIKINNGAYKV